jgi:hypothetical protein
MACRAVFLRFHLQLCDSFTRAYHNSHALPAQAASAVSVVVNTRALPSAPAQN